VWDTLYGVDAKLQPQRQMVEAEELSPDGLVWTCMDGPPSARTFRRFGRRVGSGHVSGLFARYIDRWP
jgi:hypothetical protein